jgi:hypothetical protein
VNKYRVYITILRGLSWSKRCLWDALYISRLLHVAVSRSFSTQMYGTINMKNDIIWDVTPYGSYKNRRFWGTYRLLHQVEKKRWHRLDNAACSKSHFSRKERTFFTGCKAVKYKSPGSDQIPAELYQAGVEILVSVNHNLITSFWNKEELPHHWKESIIVPIHKMGDKTVCNNYRGISLL